MKLQELTECVKAGLHEQSTLSSKLTDTTKPTEELRKEIEVTDSNFVHSYIYFCI